MNPDPGTHPDLNYPEVGASTRPGPLPVGYRHLHHRVLLGHGRAALEAAGEAVLDWRMHRAGGVLVTSDAVRAEPGAAVTCAIGLGPLRVGAPCRVIWSERGPDRYGFAYGTREGHLAVGEETFLVEMAPDKAVWFTVNAFSRPQSRLARAAGPLMPLGQRLFARACGRALTRIASTAR
ncbi:DUF1990 family protein [Kitasatospora sp. NPDC004240]